MSFQICLGRPGGSNLEPLTYANAHGNTAQSLMSSIILSFAKSAHRMVTACCLYDFTSAASYANLVCRCIEVAFIEVAMTCCRHSNQPPAFQEDSSITSSRHMVCDLGCCQGPPYPPLQGLPYPCQAQDQWHRTDLGLGNQAWGQMYRRQTLVLLRFVHHTMTYEHNGQ